MADGSNGKEAPTIYANIVISKLNVNEMTMELNCFAKPDKGSGQKGPVITNVPVESDEDVLAREPIARVILTFSAAQELKRSLDLAMPKIEQLRRSSVRVREMNFYRGHPDRFAEFVGEWVALEGETIVAHGNDPADVVEKAREKGIKIPFLLRVESKQGKNEGNIGL
ncbi:MAG TPA: DUF5678 domain-containing protein [Candidatus Binataceae bacterium]